MKILKEPTRMMTHVQYVYVVCLIVVLELFTQCHCSPSANNLIKDKISVDVNEYPDKLQDDVDTATHPNLANEANSLPLTQYYSNPITPSYEKNHNYEISANAVSNSQNYGANPVAHSPLSTLPAFNSAYHTQNRPIDDQLDINQTYFPQYDQTAYVSNNNNYIAQAPGNAIARVPTPGHHVVKITTGPFWEPDLLKLENQYMASFRSMIEASRATVTNMYYKIQTFVNYVMSFFTFDENAPGFEGRKKKFKIKKKYKKFILPLLIAYKLKFFALIPIMISGLILLLGSTGLAGFFFALFVAVISLKGGHSH